MAAAMEATFALAVMAYLTKNLGEPDIDQNGLAARLGVDRNTTSLLVGSSRSVRPPQPKALPMRA